MALYNGKNYTKKELLKRVGSISQIAGVRKVEFKEGFQKGIEAAEFRCGTGFNFTVALDRAMDITIAEFCGKSLEFRTSCEETTPYIYDPYKLDWLYNFPGGLVATCGLMNVGCPCEFDGDEKGQHGRIGNIPASSVHVDGEWVGDDYIMWAKGKMRETRFFGCNYLLERKISAKLGENKIFIEDIITNEAHNKFPLEILYHMNTGFPLVDEGSYLVFPSNKVVPRDADAEAGFDTYDKLIAPEHNYKEQCFFHDMETEDNGETCCAVINPNANMGMYVKFNKTQLPYFTEWKCMDEGQYALGLEPANCHVMGMAWEAENGTLEYLEAGESKKINLEIGVLAGDEEISKAINYINQLKCK